jgi:hypothetical protein
MNKSYTSKNPNKTFFVAKKNKTQNLNMSLTHSNLNDSMTNSVCELEKCNSSIVLLSQSDDLRGSHILPLDAINAEDIMNEFFTSLNTLS